MGRGLSAVSPSVFSDKAEIQAARWLVQVREDSLRMWTLRSAREVPSQPAVAELRAGAPPGQGLVAVPRSLGAG